MNFDFQKHGFWAILGGVLVVELALLFFMVMPKAAEVDKTNKAIQSDVAKLRKRAGERFIPNENSIKAMEGRRSDAAKQLLRGLIHYAAQDAQTIERRWNQGGQPVEDPSMIGPKSQSESTRIEKEIKESVGGRFKFLTISEDIAPGGPQKIIDWPQSPTAADGVAGFYRRWWIVTSMIDVLEKVSDAEQGKNPASFQRPWVITQVSFGSVKPQKSGFVDAYLPFTIKVRLRVTEVLPFLEAAFNTQLLLIPRRVRIKQKEPDPAEIPIPLEPGADDPTPEELVAKASGSRPQVELEFGGDVVDLDPGKLLAIGKRFKSYLRGGSDPVQAFIDELKSDSKFLGNYEDKVRFLDRMLEGLKKKG